MNQRDLFVTLPTAVAEYGNRPPKADLFHKNTLVLLAGAPKTGKTTIALALASAMVNGEEFGGLQVPRCCVGYVSFDDSPTEIVAAAKRHPGLMQSDKFFINYSNYPIDTQYGLEQIECFMYPHRPIVIIIDSLHAAISTAKVNDAQAVRKLLLPLRNMAGRSGTVILLHHTDKFGRQIADHTQLQAAVSQTIVHTVKDHKEANKNCRVITWKSTGRDLGAPQTFQFESFGVSDYQPRTKELQIHGNDRTTLPILQCLSSGAKSINEVVEKTKLDRDLVTRKLKKLSLQGRIEASYSLGTYRYSLR
jgi:RecA-family ATPase